MPNLCLDPDCPCKDPKKHRMDDVETLSSAIEVVAVMRKTVNGNAAVLRLLPNLEQTEEGLKDLLSRV